MSVSSHTLSFERESIDGDEGTPMDLDSEVEEDYSDVCSSCEGVRNSSRGKSISKDEDNMHIPIIYRRPGLPYGYTPSMLAAAHPDPRILKQVLQSGYKSYLADIDPDTLRRILAPTLGPNACCEVPGRYNDLLEDKRKCLEAQFGPDVTRMVYSKGGEGEGYTSPLMEAIHHSFPSNVRTLLEAGADPNGIPKSILSSYAALFLRFRPAIPDRDFVENGEDVATREGLLSLMHVEQTAPLTVEELEDRYWDGMAPFWCEEGHAPLNFYKGGEGMPALVEAARNGSIEIFEQLMEAGADASFWLKKQKNLPNPPTPSSLSVSSPIHAALQSRDVQMLRFLLERGFDPNLMPLATPTRCFTPLMATLIYHENFYEEAFDELAKQKEIDFDVRTPVYGVHVLHFAVATLNLELLRYVVHFIPLEKAGVTALGQNLLHIACLSPNSRAVNRESKAIFESTHETRNLHAQPDDGSGDVLYPDSNEVTAMHRAQMAVVKYLWAQGIRGISEKDLHGNTPLHYLVGVWSVNEKLLAWWLNEEWVGDVFERRRNKYGYTAAELQWHGRRTEWWKEGDCERDGVDFGGGRKRVRREEKEKERSWWVMLGRRWKMGRGVAT